MTLEDKKRATASFVAQCIVARENTPVTQGQCMKELLIQVQNLSNNDKLTLQHLKDSLQQWVNEGWATIRTDVLQITRHGQSKIHDIARNNSLALTA